MLTALLEALAQGIAYALNSIVGRFLAAMKFDLWEILRYFNSLANVYDTSQKIAVGLAGIIAITALAKFGLKIVESSQLTDSVPGVLIWTTISIIMIYNGGYLLETLVRLGKSAYDGFASGMPKLPDWDWEAISAAMTKTEESIKAGAQKVNLASAIVQLFMMSAIVISFFKLLVEVCERWLMVGVLVFFSPLAWATLPSSDTRNIARKFLSMFVGALIMMSMSVIFLRLVVDGLSTALTVADGATADEYMIKLLLVLAMCRIGQRVDSYLQQLGVGAATTGGSMFEEIVGGARALGNSLRGTGNAVGKAVGHTGDGSAPGSRSGILGFAQNQAENISAGRHAQKQAKAEGGGGAKQLGAFLSGSTKSVGDHLANQNTAVRGAVAIKNTATQKGPQMSPQQRRETGSFNFGGKNFKTREDAVNAAKAAGKSANDVKHLNADGSEKSANASAWKVDGKTFANKADAEKHAKQNKIDPSNIKETNAEGVPKKFGVGNNPQTFNSREEAQRFAEENGYRPRDVHEKGNEDDKSKQEKQEGKEVPQDNGAFMYDKTMYDKLSDAEAAKEKDLDEGRVAGDIQHVNPDGTPKDPNDSVFTYGEGDNKETFGSRDEAEKAALRDGGTPADVKEEYSDGGRKMYEYDGQKFGKREDAINSALDKEGYAGVNKIKETTPDGAQKQQPVGYSYNGTMYKSLADATEAAGGPENASNIKSVYAGTNTSGSPVAFKTGTKEFKEYNKAAAEAKITGGSVTPVHAAAQNGDIVGYRVKGDATNKVYDNQYNAMNAGGSGAEVVPVYSTSSVSEGRTDFADKGELGSINQAIVSEQTSKESTANATIARGSDVDAVVSEQTRSGEYGFTPEQTAENYSNYGIGRGVQGAGYVTRFNNGEVSVTREASSVGLEAVNVGTQSSPQYAVKVANGAADVGALSNYMATNASSYDKLNQSSQTVLMNSIQNATAEQCRIALENTTTGFVDNPAYKAMFEKVYRDALPTDRNGSPVEISSIKMDDRSGASGMGNFNMGKVYSVEYLDNGKKNSVRIYNSIAATAENSEMVSSGKLHTFRAPDGSMHLTSRDMDIVATQDRRNSVSDSASHSASHSFFGRIKGGVIAANNRRISGRKPGQGQRRSKEK